MNEVFQLVVNDRSSFVGLFLNLKNCCFYDIVLRVSL